MAADVDLVKLIAENTGWRGADLVTAVAIAIRESNGNPAAYNGNRSTGDNSYGLFQLNTLGNLWSIYQGMGFTDPKQLLDPAANARAAYALYQRNGNTFHPWLGYRPGLTVAPQQAKAQALVSQAESAGVIPQQPNVTPSHSIGQSVPIRSGASTNTTTSYTNPALGGTGTIEDTARELYGYLATYLTDPEVGPILRQAAEQGWSTQRLQGALFKTNWWQTTQASARTWDSAETQDPATARANIDQRMADIRAQAAQTGFSIDSTHLYDLARDSLRLNWSTQQLDAAIGAESSRNGKLSTSSTMQTVRATAAAYAVPMSDATLNQWGQQIATGQATQEDWRQKLVGYAKGLYPGLEKDLDRGLTVKDLADPYVQSAAQTLHLDPNTIDLSDPKWNAALNGYDQATKQRRPLTLSEWNTKIKSESRYGWSQTSEARAQAASLGAFIGQKFGKAAP